MLIEFYGQECEHCHAMEPLVKKFQHEFDVPVTLYETWHNAENEKLRQQYDKGFCGGVPFFYNTDTNKYICGEADYEELKTWAGK